MSATPAVEFDVVISTLYSRGLTSASAVAPNNAIPMFSKMRQGILISISLAPFHTLLAL